MSETSDFLVVGGGLAGSVIASRLAQRLPSTSITLLEAGDDPSENPMATAPLGCFGAHHSPMDWAYSTAPQAHLDQRRCYNSAGKVLGGGTVTNYGIWTRGPKIDYDQWAEMVQDQRWSYQGLLPYFRRTEHHYKQDSSGQHGTSGPIHTMSVSKSSPNRIYPLSRPLKDAYIRTGLRFIEDGNSGYPEGISETIENFRDGKRQPAFKAYGLDGVKVVTKALARRLIIDTIGKKKQVTGVELSDGRVFKAKETVVTCGAYRTPQLLLLSGIGPAAELVKHNIPQHVDLPVGENFHDHMSLNQFWKLKEPEKGLAVGTPLWKDPAYQFGLPNEWVISHSAPLSALKDALSKDNDTDPYHQRLAQEGRSHVETLPVYAPAGAPILGIKVPFDGTYMATAVLGMLPTSRGSITLASTNPEDAPVIDPNYYATEFDKVSLRAGIRKAIQGLLDTPEGQSVVAEELAPDGYLPLTSTSTDEEIDTRVKRAGNTFYHPAGSASMGRVVNPDLRIKGIANVSIADASIIPLPISAHYQVVTYAIAEQAVDLIVDRW